MSALYVGCGLGYVLPTVIVPGPAPNGVYENDVHNQSTQWTDEQIEEVGFQIIWMHSVSFGIALITTSSLALLNRKDQDGAPNIAEARRLSIGMSYHLMISIQLD